MSNMYYMIDYKNYPDPIIKQSGSTYYIDYGAADMSSGGTVSDHWLVNPDCTELPCPAGTTNQGTFYNHTSATAGSSLGMTVDGDIAIDSICPKGWMLPSTGIYSKKSYGNLLGNAYGGADAATNRANASTIVIYPPISLLRTGYYNHSETTLFNMGFNSEYWEAQNRNETNARRFYATPNLLAITTAASGPRGRGCSVRCVSRD